MQSILITGANSYIGMSFEKYLKTNFKDEYLITTLDMKNSNWSEFSFKEYDCVFHVAGIAHQKENSSNIASYYKVNRDLAFEVAKKAKSAGVGQFIFMSSMSIYGLNTGNINENTKPNPTTNYGKSKYQAEILINSLTDDNFKVCIVRPPMVYGENCRGNFQSLVNLSNKFPFFPKIKNERSMIYIDNLSMFLKCLMDKQSFGIFLPQNDYYVCTSDIIEVMGNVLNKKIRLSNFLGLIVRIIMPFSSKIKKAFGNLTYNSFINYNFDYSMIPFEESIKRSIKHE